MGLVDDVKAQSWYTKVHDAMAAKGVPDAVWIGVIAAENPAAVTSSTANARPTKEWNGYSYGIFQLNNNVNGIDPVYSGNWAADRLGPALAKLPKNYTDKQAVLAAEKAAWPGSTDGFGATEYPQRLAAMQDVEKQMGQKPGSPMAKPVTGWTDPISNAVNETTSNIQQGVNDGVAAIQKTATDIATNVFYGAVILAVIAGGFSLLASSGD